MGIIRIYLFSTLYTATEAVDVAAEPSTVVDTTGAGDAYAAGLIHGLVNHLTIVEAMAEAAVWSGFAVASDSSIPGKALKQYLADAT